MNFAHETAIADSLTMTTLVSTSNPTFEPWAHITCLPCATAIPQTQSPQLATTPTSSVSKTPALPFQERAHPESPSRDGPDHRIDLTPQSSRSSRTRRPASCPAGSSSRSRTSPTSSSRAIGPGWAAHPPSLPPLCTRPFAFPSSGRRTCRVCVTRASKIEVPRVDASSPRTFMPLCKVPERVGRCDI
jgi:hypothetical protein